MSRYSRSDENGFWSSAGPNTRLILGGIIVVFIGYCGVVFAPQFGLTSFWPYAGVWAAVGWGSSRTSTRPIAMLIIIGVVTDLTQDAPLGCWPAIYLIGYSVAAAFRRRASTDTSGLIRFAGDMFALLATFLAARWIIGAYLGGMETREILGGFLSSALLFLPVRPLFRIANDSRVEA